MHKQSFKENKIGKCVFFFFFPHEWIQADIQIGRLWNVNIFRLVFVLLPSP